MRWKVNIGQSEPANFVLHLGLHNADFGATRSNNQLREWESQQSRVVSALRSEVESVKSADIEASASLREQIAELQASCDSHDELLASTSKWLFLGFVKAL